MDMKRLLIGTIVGAIVLYAAGYLIFDQAFGSFYAANVGAMDALREAPLRWPQVVSYLGEAALITLCVASRAGVPTIATGFVTGGVIMFLAWLQADFALYAYTNLWNLTITILDPTLEIVHGGIGGAVIAAVFARMPKGAGLQAAQ